MHPGRLRWRLQELLSTRLVVTRWQREWAHNDPVRPVASSRMSRLGRNWAVNGGSHFLETLSAHLTWTIIEISITAPRAKQTWFVGTPISARFAVRGAIYVKRTREFTGSGFARLALARQTIAILGRMPRKGKPRKPPPPSDGGPEAKRLTSAQSLSVDSSVSRSAHRPRGPGVRHHGGNASSRERVRRHPGRWACR